jgi:hypothetical protein
MNFIKNKYNINDQIDTLQNESTLSNIVHDLIEKENTPSCKTNNELISFHCHSCNKNFQTERALLRHNNTKKHKQLKK